MSLWLIFDANDQMFIELANISLLVFVWKSAFDDCKQSNSCRHHPADVVEFKQPVPDRCEIRGQFTYFFEAGSKWARRAVCFCFDEV